jgi:hypothetical protein
LFGWLLALLGELGGLLRPHASTLSLIEDQAGGAGKLVRGSVNTVVEPDLIISIWLNSLGQDDKLKILKLRI